ncbi:hypothetical protein [Antarctobacter jejuensis]|uniref:hypothetical protein n=1 Tax=Antarctobacter jejuensis TaxID=1439938 RepID=UPI003FD10353
MADVALDHKVEIAVESSYRRGDLVEKARDDGGLCRLSGRILPSGCNHHEDRMTEKFNLDLSRLCTDVSVENAAILIAWGGPNATDLKE